jgi:hypothetical protein
MEKENKNKLILFYVLKKFPSNKRLFLIHINMLKFKNGYFKGRKKSLEKKI